MAIVEKTLDEITEDLIYYYRASEPTLTSLLNLRAYSRARSYLVPNAYLIKEYQDNQLQMYDNIFITTADSEALDRHLADRGLTRGAATKATCTVKIGSTTQPTSTVLIPQLLRLSTSDPDPILFELTESGQIDVTTPVDPITGYYITELSAQAVNAGLSGNITVGALNKIDTNIQGLDFVTNITSGVGGTDEESDESVRNRLQTVLTVYDRGTEAWFITTTLEEFDYVKDVIVTRAVYGNGSVLLNVVGFSSLTPTQLQDIEDYFNSDEIADAGGWNVTVGTITTVPIILELDVYRYSSVVDTTLITNTTQAFFNDEILIGEDFVFSQYYAYMIQEIPQLQDIQITNLPGRLVAVDTGEIASLSSINSITFIDVTP